MPAVRKPTATHEANGSFEAHPERARTGEPDTGRGVGPPPDRLTVDVQEAWDDIVGETAAGVWQSSDRVFLEVLATQVARFRREGEGYGIQRITVLLSMLSRGGMTPSDRSRVFVPKQNSNGKEKTGLASFRR